MKNLIMTFIISSCSLFLCEAQLTIIKTPNDTDVYVEVFEEMSLPDRQFLDSYYTGAYSEASFLLGSSAKYNCHSYAYLVTEGTTTLYWLNNSEMFKFWSDQSYVSTSETDATKIYYSVDHSAIKSTNGKYKSKLADGPMMEHAPSYGPTVFMGGTKTYYKKGPPKISGPTSFCANTSVSFTVTNTQQGAFYWEGSSNLTLSSTTLKTITVTGNAAGSGSLKIKNSAGTELANFNLTVGAAPNYTINGPSPGIVEQYESVYFSLSDNYTGNWSITPEGYFYPAYNTRNNVWVSCDYTGNHKLTVVVQYNGCTTTKTKNFGVSPYQGKSYILSYPNPTSNTLNVEIDRETHARGQSLEQNVTRVKQIKADPIFDIRLYDGQGNLLRNAKVKDGKVEFNVSNLPTGIYYLHVYDSINEKPEVRQIVVER